MSRTIYDLICEVNEVYPEIFFEKIEAVSLVGDVLSNAYKHPLQYHAFSNRVAGMDDPFEGIGWSAHEALRNLLADMKMPVLDEEQHE